MSLKSRPTTNTEGDLDRVISEAPAASRSAHYSADFTAVNDEMIKLVAGCTDKEWRTTCADEGWSVAVLAHHVASTLPAFSRLIEQIASDASVAPDITRDQINQTNAQHAQDYQDVGKAEVLNLLRTRGADMTRVLSSLNDEQLAHTSTAFGGYEFSLAQLTERVFIGHSRLHLTSMKTALEE